MNVVGVWLSSWDYNISILEPGFVVVNDWEKWALGKNACCSSFGGLVSPLNNTCHSWNSRTFCRLSCLAFFLRAIIVSHSPGQILQCPFQIMRTVKQLAAELLFDSCIYGLHPSLPNRDDILTAASTTQHNRTPVDMIPLLWFTDVY